LFHLFLATGFLLSFAIVKFGGEHSELFPYHMMLGIVLGAMVSLRVIWGFLGTKYARFSSLQLNPLDLVRYARTALSKRGPQYTGHNPASSYAILIMLALAGVLVASGLLMTRGGEGAEEVHASAAYLLLAVAAIHVLGVIWYSIRHRQNISWSMVTGYKVGEPQEAIRTGRPVVAIGFAAAVLMLLAGLVRNYDEAQGTTTLPVTGTVIHLGESDHD
jgi:cytochrome b